MVRLSHVRELSAVRESFDATKGIIVTTSRLTREAIEWIRRDACKLSFKDNQKLIEWILKCKEGPQEKIICFFAAKKIFTKICSFAYYRSIFASAKQIIKHATQSVTYRNKMV